MLRMAASLALAELGGSAASVEASRSNFGAFFGFKAPSSFFLFLSDKAAKENQSVLKNRPFIHLPYYNI